MQKPALSFTKGGDIYVPSCDKTKSLYPLTDDPSTWPHCNDANEYTWSIKQDDLSALIDTDRLKLARSAGFCPHDRCQLGNLTNADANGHCPANLCYTKLENGGRSYGACCFIGGRFNSGQIIGFYNKIQHTPKPIYKRSRIILGDVIGGLDESYESFVNANQIHNSIVATQCPLPNTVEDVLRMLVEQNVSLWVQLAPFIDQSGTNNTHTASQCQMNPSAFFDVSQRLNSTYVSLHNLRQIPLQEYGLQRPTFSVETFDVHYYSSSSSTERTKRVTNTVTQDSSFYPAAETTTAASHQVTNVWYNNWRDFEVPAPEDEQVPQHNHCLLFT